MTKTYNFQPPSEMTDDILKDIIVDLQGCAKQELTKGNVINFNKISRAKALLGDVINLLDEVESRNKSESDFLETHHESF